MSLPEIIIVLLILGGTFVLAQGHSGGRLFNWLIDHKPASHTGYDPQERTSVRDRRRM